MTRAALYARYSSDRQREASIEDQLRLCEERAAHEGWTVAQVYTDAATSGASLLRPGIQALMDDVSRGSAEIVLVEALDRLSRDQADVAMLFKRLSFAGARIVTLAEGEIGELHVGLKGTMNQLFLKDLADKTRRGLRGRVEQGRSGGGKCYGYDVVRRLDPAGEPVHGERAVNDQEAAVVRRIFGDFAGGKSPKAIARELNAEGVPGPRGKLWRDTAIRGHRSRGTGILNNELYIGRLVWNRLRYVKDPETGKRVSRPNPEEAWIVTEVPELRIVAQDLWDRVKVRQAEIEAEPRVQAIRQTRFWEHRRKRHLLTGLAVCGSCGGTFTAVGKDYLACANARKLGTCEQRKSVRRAVLEETVLELLKTRLMEPDAVAAFVTAYQAEQTAQARAAAAGHTERVKERAAVARKLEGMYDAIADGLRTAGLRQKLEGLEARLAELDVELEAGTPSPVRLHPKLPELYRRKVADLAETLKDPAIRDEALEIMRGLIDRVVVQEEGGGTGGGGRTHARARGRAGRHAGPRAAGCCARARCRFGEGGCGGRI